MPASIETSLSELPQLTKSSLGQLWKPGSKAAQICRSTQAIEKYYCNFGLNPAYQGKLERAGLEISGGDPFGETRVMELPGHSFFLGLCLSHKPIRQGKSRTQLSCNGCVPAPCGRVERDWRESQLRLNRYVAIALSGSYSVFKPIPGSVQHLPLDRSSTPGHRRSSRLFPGQNRRKRQSIPRNSRTTGR
jgi:hypothetical protein